MNASSSLLSLSASLLLLESLAAAFPSMDSLAVAAVTGSFTSTAESAAEQAVGSCGHVSQSGIEGHAS